MSPTSYQAAPPRNTRSVIAGGSTKVNHFLQQMRAATLSLTAAPWWPTACWESCVSTVLIIDDSEAVRLRVQEVLAQEPKVSRVLTASDGIAGFKLLTEHPVDLILCDLIMPVLDGFKFLALKQTKKELADIPVIMLTGEEDIRAKVRGLEAGAHDYLTKPFDAHELLARLRIHLKLKDLQDALKEKNLRLEQLSRTDELTGLNNRRYFMEMLRTEFRRAERYGEAFVLVMVDIDHFKRVNDTYGHLMGDRALVTVAQRLTQSARTQECWDVWAVRNSRC